MNMDDLFYFREDEKPLDHIVTDGGYCGIFRTIGCVGDSLASGEFESYDAEGNIGYHDMFEYSWGQYLARMAGCKVLNFSRGGMTAKEYCESFAEKMGFWRSELACQAYIIALGVNDIYNQHQPIGSVEDLCKEDCFANKPTFAGYYAQIVSRLKQIQPHAKFFFVTMPRAEVDSEEKSRDGDAHAKLLYDLAEYFDRSYVIDLRKYSPVHTKEFCNRFLLASHMNPCGYLLTAKMIASYIDYLIRHNPEEFKQVPFIGTPWENLRDSSRK